MNANLRQYLKVAKKCSRTISSDARTRPSGAYLDPTRIHNELSFDTSPLDLTHTEREALDSALRVNQAGEIAANWIYQGQMAVLSHDNKLRSLIQVSRTVLTMTAQQSSSLSRICGTKRKTISQ
jgi:ubiquinone biosynthesis monooxygenase Coq7